MLRRMNYQELFKRLWIVRRLKEHGANIKDMVEVYTKQIRPVLEFSVPVWHPSITSRDSKAIERVQKSFTKIVLQKDYQTYKKSLLELKLDPLELRRSKLCLKFGLKSEKHTKFKHWFKSFKKGHNTRIILRTMHLSNI